MYTFSLVLATYGRVDEVDMFFKSIECSEYDLKKLEIIVVDQNDKLNLDDIISKYRNIVDIKHIKSNVKGLSKNRNIGIKESTGKYIAFPDDDCKYMKDTLKTVENIFEQNDSLYAVMGKIIDENNENCIRNWSNIEENINKSNFYTKISSITLFKRNTEPKNYFNELLGVGAPFGSNEDANMIYKIIKDGKKIKYFPNIVLFHPKPPQNLNQDKVYNYGLGFGALCKENLDFNILVLFIKVICYHNFKLFLAAIKLDNKAIKLRYKYIVSRINGFIQYNKNRKDIIND